MTNAHASLSKILFCCLLAFSAAGCTSLKLPGGKDAATTSTGAATEESKPVGMTGNWSVGFKYNNETLSASMTLKQDGSTFEGTGKDEQEGTPFRIEQGQVRGDQVSFVKKYGGNLAKVPPIQYAGTISVMHSDEYTGPYLKGDYTAKDGDGNPISNDWDAVIDKPKAVAVAPPPEPAPAPTPAPAPQPAPQPQAPQGETHPDKAPDLSGKWDVGYEYKFRTVHSIMFLEQEFDQVVGHGLDDNKEKFVFDKIFYKYPKITLIRKYTKGATAAAAAPAKGKGKGKEAPKPAGGDRTMTFKGDVSVVNDADYQGPYMRGKTDGGGSWEAQRVK